MYQRYASSRSWTFDILDIQPGEMGGVKTAIIELEGEGAWSELGYESGTHQVKRVPATEVLITADGQRLALQQAQADAIGALGRLVPHRPEPEPGALEFRALGLIRHAVDHHAAGVGVTLWREEA